jgi:glycosyltransferase involved in cell wall biosynthesis
MASGVPVVCSDIPVFREVYGDVVRYVDPNRAESIAGGIREVLDDSSLSDSLRQRGRERASIYRHERSIRRYLDLVEGGKIST